MNWVRAIAPVFVLWSTAAWGATIIWSANSEPDLAGYHVYQCSQLPCAKSSGTATLLATLGKVTSFNIGTPAVTQYYVITAYDLLNYESSPSTVTTYLPGGASPPPPVSLSPPVMAYGMNEGSGTTLTDASDSGHVGTLINGPAWVLGQATYGKALSFDGVNDAVSVASPSALDVGGYGDFTIEMWVKRNMLGGGQKHLFSKCAPTWVLGCKEFYFNPSNQLTFGSFRTGDTFAGTIADTTWHHVAVTFTNATNLLNIYVDGVLRTSVIKTLEGDGTGHVVTVGNHQGSNPFSGLLDDVRIYSRALTLAEIQTDRTRPIVP